MLGELTQDQIIHVLQNQVIGRIGCCHNKKVYVVPITYAYNDKYIYAHSKEGLKISMMRSNPEVCFEVDSMENMANWRSVVVWGTFEELKSTEEQKRGMEILVSKVMPFTTSETVRAHDHSQEPAIVIKGKRPIVFRIRLKEMTGRFEKK